MDKQREEFEAWVREHGNHPRRPELKTSDGAYHYLHTESEWRAWQAAQAAQPVTKAAPAFVERTTEDILRDALNLAADTCESTLYVGGDGTVSVFGPKTDANVEIRKCRDAIRALAQPPAPDCRTCDYRETDADKKDVCYAGCVNGDEYRTAPKVVLWRTE